MLRLILLSVLAVAPAWGQVARAPAPENPDLDRAARLLAGFAIEGDEAAARRIGLAWQSHSRSVQGRWRRYVEDTYAPIRRWVDAELPDLAPGVVFYPFSGPDILNAHAFFPKGRTYIMLGLEKIGEIPRPDQDPPRHAAEGLEALRGALVNILGMNFFRTQTMAQKIGAHPYSGVAGVLLFFLKNTGHEIVDARLIELDETGRVVPEGAMAQRQGLRDHGVQIRFRLRGTQPVRTLYYFRGDISDGRWSRRPGLPAFVSAQGQMVTFLKAASYLMYEPGFDDIRRTILARSSMIVTAASGMPYHYLARDNSWDLRLFGRYDGPIDLFKQYCQPDLEFDMHRHSRGILPFSYDYNHRVGEGHVIVARRRPGFVTREPDFDNTHRRGERTRCRRGQLNITYQAPEWKTREMRQAERKRRKGKAVAAE
ncbi:MAG: hypothetical protein KC613_00680 [Myxococcales bacterium]|nr:hypothetical protein [Myxococcales bacterium]